MEIPNFDPVQVTTINRPLTVFDPARDLSAYWTPPPPDWANALETVAPTINQKLAEQSASGESWATTLQKILPALATTVQQREILQIQLERARRGMPPLDNSQFGAQVNIGLDPGTRNAIMVAGLAVAGLLAWRYLKR